VLIEKVEYPAIKAQLAQLPRAAAITKRTNGRPRETDDPRQKTALQNSGSPTSPSKTAKLKNTPMRMASLSASGRGWVRCLVNSLSALGRGSGVRCLPDWKGRVRGKGSFSIIPNLTICQARRSERTLHTTLAETVIMSGTNTLEGGVPERKPLDVWHRLTDHD